MANIGTPILGLPITIGGLSGEEWVPLVQGGTTKRTQANKIGLGTITQLFPAGIDYVMSGGGTVVPAGVNGTGIVVPFNCTIAEVVVNGNNSAGSVVVDIWKCTESQFDGGLTHPVVGDSITGSAKPTIAVGSKYSDTGLSGWTVALSQGDVLWYNIESVSVFTCVTVALKVSRAIP